LVPGWLLLPGESSSAEALPDCARPTAPLHRKRKRLGLADGEQTSYDKVASNRRRCGVNHRANLTRAPGGVDEPGDSNRLNIGLAPFVHHQYAELAG
jgi:hypothetical protein